MAKILNLIDYLTIEKPIVYTDTLNLLEDLFSQTRPIGLDVRIRATHSGYLLNGRVYPGRHMKDSCSSWVSEDRGGCASYDKPVLIHHRQQDGEPIGRVISADFTQLIEGDDFKNDWRNPVGGTKFGSGYITLGTKISDKEAIMKIADGRYSTVSTGQKTDNAICSVCGLDWLNDGEGEICEHRPGRVYDVDGKNYRCYLVTGPLEYREVSYVNVPAQPNARTLTVNAEALEAAIEGSQSSDLAFSASYDGAAVQSLMLADFDGNAVELLLKEGANDQLPDLVTSLKSKKVFAMETPTTEASEAIEKSIGDENVISEDSPTKDPIDETEKEQVPLPESSSDEDNSTEETSPVSEEQEEITETEHLDDEELSLMVIAKSIVDADMLDRSEETECEFSAEDIERMASAFEDATLSTAQRKKLKASTFCGPNRSFPVPDCAHVTAAKRLIGRAKVGSSTKQRIMACVNRRSRSMNCGGDEDCSLQPLLKETQMSESNVSGYALEDALETMAAAKAELEEKLRRLQSNLDTKVALCAELTQENSSIKGQLVEQAAHQLAIMRINLGKPGTLGVNSKEKLEEYTESLTSRSLDSLQDSIADMLPEIEHMLTRTTSTDAIRELSVEDPTQTRLEKQSDDGESGDRQPISKHDLLKDL